MNALNDESYSPFPPALNEMSIMDTMMYPYTTELNWNLLDADQEVAA